MGRTAIISDKQVTMHVVRRALLPPSPGLAEARHAYTTLFTTKASVKTMSGTAEWNTIAVEGKQVSHVWSIRYTTIPFDKRDRVKDGNGTLYQILKTEDVDLANRTMKIFTAKIGDPSLPVNQ